MRNRICITISFFQLCVFYGGLSRNRCSPFSMVSFLACACPNRSGAGAVDDSDRFEKVFDQYDISEVHEKFHGRLFDGLSSENVHFWCL